MTTTTIKRTVIGVIALVIIAIILVFIWNGRTQADSTFPKAVKIDTQGQPTLGNPKAKIHIVAFEDLKCGNCMRFNTTLLPTIKKMYIDSGKAKYTMINLAFIPNSMPAANAARCIYMQNKQLFFPFVKYVYYHQPPETENWATLPKLLQFAGNIKGVDIKKLSECIYNSPYTSFINNNLKMASKLMHGSVATPSIYVNGVLVRPLTLKNFKAAVKATE